jgi:nucleoside-diphosphate-sugar epimerase
VSRAEGELGYRVTTPIAAGIPKFVAWYKQQRTQAAHE